MHAPIITLTTDFGTREPWVGIMKGVILGICPDARLVDLTHEIAPQDVVEGAMALESATRFFPPGTVHLAVVDPGVGSSRRPVAAHLAAGLPLERLGPRLADPVMLPLPRARRDGDMVVGEVIAADRFGNLVTSVT